MAHLDLDKLLQNILFAARKMIDEHGEFFPFGSTLGTKGELALFGTHTESEQPPSQECADRLVGGFRSLAKEGKIIACGICYDVRTIPPGQTEKVDAICARLEHNCGEAVDVFLPYHKGWLGRIKYGEIFASRGTKTIFGNEKQTINFPPA